MTQRDRERLAALKKAKNGLIDPQEIWQDQPTEPLKLSRAELRQKAVKLQSKARFAALFTVQRFVPRFPQQP